VPAAAPPIAAVVPVAAAGADSPLAAVAVEDGLFDSPLAEEPADVVDAPGDALDPAAAVEALVPAVVVAVALG